MPIHAAADFSSGWIVSRNNLASSWEGTFAPVTVSHRTMASMAAMIGKPVQRLVSSWSSARSQSRLRWTRRRVDDRIGNGRGPGVGVFGQATDARGGRSASGATRSSPNNSAAHSRLRAVGIDRASLLHDGRTLFRRGEPANCISSPSSIASTNPPIAVQQAGGDPGRVGQAGQQPLQFRAAGRSRPSPVRARGGSRDTGWQAI